MDLYLEKNRDSYPGLTVTLIKFIIKSAFFTPFHNGKIISLENKGIFLENYFGPPPKNFRKYII